MTARFAHVNLVAENLERLVAFYVDAFGCARGVERVYETPEQTAALARGLGVGGLTLRGIHLVLPGHGADGPTLEVFQYEPRLPRPAAGPNTPGFGHVAFLVDDVEAACARVVASGGSAVGEVVTVPYPTGGRLSWRYVRDPEGNFVELQTKLDADDDRETADGASSLRVRLERVTAFVADAAGAPCALCDRPLCRHEAVLSYAAGRLDAPLCLGCLAEDLGRAPTPLRDELAGYVLRKDCLSRAWADASRAEGFAVDAPPRCLWPAGDAIIAAATAAPAPRDPPDPLDPPHASARWDAGDTGCGELVFELRSRLAALAPGETLHLTARDPGAPQDLPSWCRLTGNRLAAARPPDYWIQRRS
jgi:predicted enzyme related to lactoylglutathione lyase/TusA-related sulfurtransferase